MMELQNVSKTFDHLTVLRRLSLTVRPGEKILLLGANGSGKSTLLKVMAGLSRVDAGVVTRSSSSVGFVSHHLFIYGRLPVRENLSLFAAIEGSGGTEEAIERFQLKDVADRAVSTLSKGNQARVGIARAFVGAPELILLDEPTSNLDEQATNVLLSAIHRRGNESGGKASVVFATHDIHRVSGMATRVVVLHLPTLLHDSGANASRSEIDRVIGLYREVNR